MQEFRIDHRETEAGFEMLLRLPEDRAPWQWRIMVYVDGGADYKRCEQHAYTSEEAARAAWMEGHEEPEAAEAAEPVSESPASTETEGTLSGVIVAIGILFFGCMAVAVTMPEHEWIGAIAVLAAARFAFMKCFRIPAQPADGGRHGRFRHEFRKGYELRSEGASWGVFYDGRHVFSCASREAAEAYVQAA